MKISKQKMQEWIDRFTAVETEEDETKFLEDLAKLPEEEQEELSNFFFTLWNQESPTFN